MNIDKIYLLIKVPGPHFDIKRIHNYFLVQTHAFNIQRLHRSRSALFVLQLSKATLSNDQLSASL